ncbi:MAG: hypothetical protein GYA24_24615 [Candidatus Lokiarchaeota archaeon]|nr:hypothetical protein [Candidatus Lokiarchaeota archaeon]
MSDEFQAYPELDHVAIQRCDGEGEVISIKISPGERFIKRVRIRGFYMAIGLFGLFLTGLAFGISYGITRLISQAIMLAGMSVAISIVAYTAPTAETEIRIDKATGTLSLSRIFLGKYSRKKRSVLFDDIAWMNVDAIQLKNGTLKVISVWTRRGKRFLIDGVAMLGDDGMQTIAAFLYKQCMGTDMPENKPLPEQSTTRPLICPTCTLPLAGKSKRSCTRCGIWWCLSCGCWNTQDRERCDGCSFMRPSD